VDGQLLKKVNISGIQKLEGGRSDLTEDSDGDEYADFFKKMERNYKDMPSRSQEAGKSIAYSLFNSENQSLLHAKNTQNFETYLRTQDGKMMHPNTIRFMVYKTKALLLETKKKLESEIREHHDFLKAQKHNLFVEFVNPKSDDKDEKPTADLVRGINTKKKKNAEKLSDLKQKYGKYLEWTEELSKAIVLNEVYGEANNYLDKIANSFERFFTSFGQNVEQIEFLSYELKNRYSNVKGSATHYVCASPECIGKISDEAPYMGSQFELDNNLVEKIYQRVREYAMYNAKDKTMDFFDRLFTQDILGYFKEQVMSQYGSQVKMDIIDALKKEVELTEGERNVEAQYKYAQKLLDSSKLLAKPFLELPRIETVQPIMACTYNKALEKSNDPHRTEFIRRQLDDYGAVPTENEVDEHTILFYQALYSIKASSLSKFAPPLKTQTSEHMEGSYSRAYWELIHQLKPGKSAKPIITPHIHKDWHLLNRMPDIDESSQTKTQMGIYTAVFRGLIEGKIEFMPLNDGINVYRYSGSHPIELKVSNGTPCDHFYEVFDAFSLNQELVANTMESVNDDFERTKVGHKEFSFKETPLCKRLEKFMLNELVQVYKAEDYLFQKDGEVVNSIFDIPLFYRISGRSIVEAKEGIDILSAILTEIRHVVEESETEEYIDQVFVQFIVSQFEIFEANIAGYYLGHLKETWMDSYLDTVLHTIVEHIKDKPGNEARKFRLHVEDYIEKHKKQALEHRK